MIAATWPARIRVNDPSPEAHERPRGRRAAEQRDELAAISSMGSSPEPAAPAYRRLRMHQRDRQVLGAGMNCSESEGAPSCGGQMATARWKAGLGRLASR
jgi:hypothetical protein